MLGVCVFITHYWWLSAETGCVVISIPLSPSKANVDNNACFCPLSLYNCTSHCLSWNKQCSRIFSFFLSFKWTLCLYKLLYSSSASHACQQLFPLSKFRLQQHQLQFDIRGLKSCFHISHFLIARSLKQKVQSLAPLYMSESSPSPKWIGWAISGVVIVLFSIGVAWWYLAHQEKKKRWTKRDLELAKARKDHQRAHMYVNPPRQAVSRPVGPPAQRQQFILAPAPVHARGREAQAPRARSHDTPTLRALEGRQPRPADNKAKPRRGADHFEEVDLSELTIPSRSLPRKPVPVRKHPFMRPENYQATHKYRPSLCNQEDIHPAFRK